MAGNSKFKVEITAENKTAQGLKQAKAGFEQLAKPAERINAVTGSWSKGTGVGRIGEVFSGAARQASKFADAGAEASAGMLGLEGSAAVAALGVGALAVGLGVAAEKGISFVNGWSAGAAGLGRMATLLGMNARELQLFQRAGEYAGVDANETASGLRNLNNVINDARYGRNDQARQVMNQLGLQMELTRSGAVDTKAMLLQVADALHNEANPATRELIANIFGVTAMLPELAKGSKAVADDLNTALKSGTTVSDEQAAAAQRYQANLKQLKQEMGGLKTEIANDLLPAFNGLLDVMNKTFQHMHRVHAENERRGAVFVPSGGAGYGIPGGYWVEAPEPAKAPANPAAASGSRVTADWVREGLQKRGWDAAHALGVTAGIFAEDAGFDPNASNLAGGGLGAWYLGQWRGDRLSRIRSRYGNSPTPDQQLDFLDWELRGGDRGGAAVRGASDPGSIMAAYLADFMRPAGGLAGDLQRGEQFLGGKVHVDIRLNGAPTGTTASVASTSPQIAPALQIGTSLPSF
jgi:hypothetical protein